MAPRPTPKLEDHTFSAVSDYLFNIFSATLRTGGRFSILNPEDAPRRGDRDPLLMSSQLMRAWICQFVEKYFEFPLRISYI